MAIGSLLKFVELASLCGLTGGVMAARWWGSRSRRFGWASLAMYALLTGVQVVRGMLWGFSGMTVPALGLFAVLALLVAVKREWADNPALLAPLGAYLYWMASRGW